MTIDLARGIQHGGVACFKANLRASQAQLGGGRAGAVDGRGGNFHSQHLRTGLG